MDKPEGLDLTEILDSPRPARRAALIMMFRFALQHISRVL